jgi:excisionase family DNA binding protein
MLDLKPEEISAAIDSQKYPPILTPEQAAQLLQIAKTTLYRKVSEGHFKPAVRRGNPLRFWRDRLIKEFMQLGQ